MYLTTVPDTSGGKLRLKSYRWGRRPHAIKHAPDPAAREGSCARSSHRRRRRRPCWKRLDEVVLAPSVAKLSWRRSKAGDPVMRRMLLLGRVHVERSRQWRKPKSTPPRPWSALSVPRNSLSSIIPTAPLRSRLARKAEDLERAMAAALAARGRMEIANYHSGASVAAPRIRRAFGPVLYESDGGELKVQIDVCDSASLRSADFDMEVYRALFLEYAYRNVPPKAGKAFHQPPAWLIEGLYEDVVARQRRRRHGTVRTTRSRRKARQSLKHS